MTALVVFKALKWTGLLALGYAAGAAVWGAGPSRPRAGLAVFPVALLATYLGGYGMLEHSGLTIAEPWVAGAMAAGVVAAGSAAMQVTGTGSRWAAAGVLGGIGAALGAMVLRDIAWGAGLAMGALGAVVVLGGVPRATPATPDATYRWIQSVGRAEGASLLVLFGVAMPAKYALGEPLLVSWVGWAHGVLFLLFVAALAVGVRRLGWSVLDAAIGVVAAMLPFGTFAFERWVSGRALRARAEAAPVRLGMEPSRDRTASPS